jgi:hypothetical protein
MATLEKEPALVSVVPLVREVLAPTQPSAL